MFILMMTDAQQDKDEFNMVVPWSNSQLYK